MLQGYELYLVEQWACSRQSPTLVISTYTGDPNHSIVVGVLGVPLDEQEWSPRLRVYFRGIQQYHARPKETEAGELMVTNLSSFPSALTVIPVPDGDIRKHRQMFIINEDLKRLGCSGRSGMTLSDPTPATQAKFLQLYKTSDRVPFAQSVTELVKLCQAALFIFDKLEQEYIDGLLCDLTETAINNWWIEVGSEYYNAEPTDGILGPTTVAALLGTLLGARNRLSYYGAPVSKDVFDLDNMKRGIGTFQKAHKLERTRRLDRQTLLKLHTVTAKAAAGEGGWGVQKAVKSTVAEIGGKRGEIVMDMVGRREKAGIADAETMDLDKFIDLVYGERAKWLWHGKPRRTIPEHHHDHPLPSMGGLIFGKESRDETSVPSAGGKTQPPPPLDEPEQRRKEESPGLYSPYTVSSPPAVSDSPGERDALRKTVFKSVAGKVNDARSGFGRIRDAVGAGLRGHSTRPSRDETTESGMTGYSSPSISTLAQTSTAPSSLGMPPRAFTWKNKPEEYLNAFKKEREAESVPILSPDTGDSEVPAVPPSEGPRPSEDGQRLPPKVEARLEPQKSDIRKELVASDPSIEGSTFDDADLQGPLLTAERNSTIALSHLQRRHSINISSLTHGKRPDVNRWPRRLSFSEAEEAVLTWNDIVDVRDQPNPVDATVSLQELKSTAEISQSLYDKIVKLQLGISPWVSAKLSAVESLDNAYGRQRDDLQNVYYQLADVYQQLKSGSDELVAEERAHLTEAVKDVEMLVAKLEYEINALVGKVQDVEDGVNQFETQVEDVEKRAEELKTTLETESWVHWFVRTLTGVGTGPNITRGQRPQGS